MQYVNNCDRNLYGEYLIKKYFILIKMHVY